MTFKETFPDHLKMNPLENFFKQYYNRFPERSLQLPHPSESISDILKIAAQETNYPVPDRLLESCLDEALFFRSGFDSYLPAPAWASPP